MVWPLMRAGACSASRCAMPLKSLNPAVGDRIEQWTRNWTDRRRTRCRGCAIILIYFWKTGDAGKPARLAKCTRRESDHRRRGIDAGRPFCDPEISYPHAHSGRRIGDSIDCVLSNFGFAIASAEQCGPCGPETIKSRQEANVKIDTLSTLLQEELKDIYDAEKRLVKALPKMAKAASSEELRQALQEHLEV